MLRHEIENKFKNAIASHQAGNLLEAKKKYKKLIKIIPNNFKINFLLGTVLAQLKEYSEAKLFIKKSLKLNPPNLLESANCYYNLGKISDDQGNTDDAILNYSKSIELNPNSEQTLNNFGNALYKVKNFKKAELIFQNLISLNTQNSNAFLKLGSISFINSDEKKAIKYLLKGIDLKPDALDHSLAQTLGVMFTNLGDKKKASEYFEIACSLYPNNYFYLFLLQKIKNKNISNKEYNLIKSSLENDAEFDLPKSESTISQVKDYLISFSENKAYGHFLLANFEHYNKNYVDELKYLKSAHDYLYDAKKDQNHFEQGLIYYLNKLPKIVDLFDPHSSSITNYKSNFKLKPIFIIGVPRSGSTLIEQIITSSEDHIIRTEESSIIDTTFQKDFKNFDDQTKIDLKKLSLTILDMLSKYNIKNTNDVIYTDKSLANFFYIGWIKNIFPNAKIINCTRDPYSSIMSIFKNDLINLSWAHDLDNIFKYFDNYFKIIKFWEESYPSSIYHLEYEKLVTDPELESKKLFEYCSISWSPKCLEFYKKKNTVVRTASFSQIRDPISSKNLKQYDESKKLFSDYKDKFSWFV